MYPRNSRGLLSIMLVTLLWSAQAAAALNVVVEANPDPALPGEQLDVEITLTNDGGSTSGAVTLNLLFPAGLDALPDASFDGVCGGFNCDAGETAVFTVGTIPAGGGRTFSLNPKVALATAGGTSIDFAVDVIESGSTVASGSGGLDVATGRVIELAVAENVDPVSAGGQLRYTLDFGVDAASAGLASASLNLNLPAGVSLLNAPGGVLSSGAVEWTLGALNPGDSGQRFAIVQVNGGVGDGTILQADATLTDGGTNSASFAASTRVGSGEALALSLVASPSPAVPGEVLDIELTITNTAATALTGVELALEFPAELSGFPDALSDGDCPGFNCEGGERLVFTIDDLAAGRGKVFWVPAKVAAAIADGSIAYLEAVASDGAGSTIEASTNIRVDAGRERELRVDNNRDPVRPADEITYELVYGTLLTSPGSPDARLSLEVPAGTMFVSASGGGVLNSGVVEWSLGPLNPGESGFRQAVFSVDGSLGNGTILPGRATFFDATNSQLTVLAADHTRVEPALPLQLTVASSADTLTAGELMDVEISVGNASGLNRSGVVMELEFPAYLVPLSDTLVRGDCTGFNCEAGERLTFTVGNLAAGSGDTFSLPLRVIAAPVDGSTIPLEVNATDNTGVQVRDTALLRVETGDPLSLEVGDSADPVLPGASFEYVVAFGFDANATGAAAGSLTLELPDSVSVDSASDGGTINGRTVSWALGALNPGAGGRRTVQVTVSGGATQGEILDARASLTDGNSNASTQRANQLTRIAPNPALDLQLVANPNPALPGEILDVELSVSNTSGLDRSDVVIEVEVDDGLVATPDAFLGIGDCAGFNCEATERIVFDIGTLGGNEGRTFLLPLQIFGSEPGGSVIRFDARVTDSTTENVRAGDVTVVDANRILQLALSESVDPIAPGDNYVYTLTLAQIEPSLAATNALVTLTLPPEVAFVSASDSGVLAGQTVTWSLGNLSAGEGIDLTVAVSLAGGAATGTLRRALAQIEDAGVTFNPTQVAAISRVQAPLPLTLSISETPNPADPGELLDVDLVVANEGSLSRSNVVVTLEYPVGLSPLSDSGLDGACPGFSCEAQERLVFDLGTLVASEQRTLSIAPMVAAATANGSIVTFDAFVEDATGATADASRDLLVGRVIDLDDDDDGIPDDLDNCPFQANPNQEDFDGDDLGDVCDPDDDNDGVNDVADAFPFDASETTDTDGDGIGNNTDADDDDDGLSDDFETANALDPLDELDALGDPDLDNASNLAEAQANTDPRDPTSQPPTAVAPTLVASVLPSSRSVQIDGLATAFASMINAAGTEAKGCTFVPLTPLVGTYFFRTTNPFTNEVTGARNGAVDIPAGAFQTFLFGISPGETLTGVDILLRYACEDTEPATILVGLNTLLLSASASPTADIVALGATNSNDGTVHLDTATGNGSFAVASVNVGVAGTITVRAQSTDPALPLILNVCQTDPVSGVCTSPTFPAESTTVTIAANATPTFGIFVTGTEPIAFSPGVNRVKVVFTDPLDVVRGSTSVAVERPQP